MPNSGILFLYMDATQMNWPFPQFPAVPWTAKQIKEYAQQQRAQTEDAPL